MNRKAVVLGAVLVTLLTTISTPVFAETSKDAARIEKLEERVRNLEVRTAKVEASTHKQMGMMQHDHAMQGKGTGMNNPMGQAPQQVPPQNPNMGGSMPQGGAPQQQGGGMPGGMGDM